MKNKYSTDGKVVHLSTEEDINQKLSKIIGKNFLTTERAGMKLISLI